MAKSTDPATWATFEDAVRAVARWRCDGVGFIFGSDRAYTGLDLDHVLVDGVLDAEYRWVVDEAGTYTEVSPSGDGLHLIFRGSKPVGADRSRRGQPGGRVVEMYDHDRYFTVTGDVFEGHGAVAANPEVVAKAYRTWIEPERKAAQPSLADAARTLPDAGSAGDLSDAELIERMCASRSGDDIRALMAGDCSAQGGDHSAADMALCSHLAFWCAGDAARMDRIFRSSGLMRDKWDSRRGGTTYGAQTIERAISSATDFYQPRAKRKRGKRSLPNDKNICSTATRRERRGVSDDAEPREGTGELPDGAPSVEGWLVDRQGRLWVADAEGELRYTVTATAPWIACDLVDVDTGDVRALVRVAVAGQVRERALDRDVLLNQSGLATPIWTIPGGTAPPP
ncbi:phage NrS-1 polymerase family protein [Collinsella bouchesdurhonensis]